MFYLVETPGTKPGAGLPDWLSIFGVTHWFWIIMIVASSLNMMYVTFRFVLKLIHYQDLLRRKADHGQGTAVA